MSGIDKPLKVPLLVKRGKSATFTVQPLGERAPRREPPAVDWDAEIEAAGGDMDAIKAIWGRANSLGDTAALAKIKAAGDAILAANQTN
jgi:hypothetical protein